MADGLDNAVGAVQAGADPHFVQSYPLFGQVVFVLDSGAGALFSGDKVIGVNQVLQGVFFSGRIDAVIGGDQDQPFGGEFLEGAEAARRKAWPKAAALINCGSQRGIAARPMPVPRKLSASCGTCVAYEHYAAVDLPGCELDGVYQETEAGLTLVLAQ